MYLLIVTNLFVMKFFKSLFATILMFSISLTVVAYDGSTTDKQNEYAYVQDVVENATVVVFDFTNVNRYSCNEDSSLSAINNTLIYTEYKKPLSGRFIYLCPKINSKYHCDWLTNPNKTC